jgi:hypothetical protein
MKILALLLFSTTMAIAQSREPFKDANTIVFNTSLTDREAFEKTCRTLVDHGYALETINEDYYQVRTHIKATKNAGKYFLIVNVDNGRIFMRPMMKDEKTGVYNWSYRKGAVWFEREVHDEIIQYFSALGEPMYVTK